MGACGVGVLSYVLTPSDAAFTEFIANVSATKALAERHNRLSRSERNLLRYIKTNAALAAEKS